MQSRQQLFYLNLSRRALWRVEFWVLPVLKFIPGLGLEGMQVIQEVQFFWTGGHLLAWEFLRSVCVPSSPAIVTVFCFPFLPQVIPLLLQLTSRLQGVRALGQTGSDTSGPEDAKRQTKKQKMRRTWGERNSCPKWHICPAGAQGVLETRPLDCSFDRKMWTLQFYCCFMSPLSEDLSFGCKFSMVYRLPCFKIINWMAVLSLWVYLQHWRPLFLFRVGTAS